MRSNRQFCWTILAVILSVFLSGCGVDEVPEELKDLSPFTGVPCAAPCWRGLAVGESSENDVEAALSNLKFIDQDSISRRPVYMSGLVPETEGVGKVIAANCIRPSQPCLTLRIFDGTLVQIRILLNYDISFGQAIDYLGPPDYVGTEVMGAEVTTCQVDLIWYRRQLVVNTQAKLWHTSNPNDDCEFVHNTGKPRSNLIISEVNYMTTAWIDYSFMAAGRGFLKFTGTSPEN